MVPLRDIQGRPAPAKALDDRGKLRLQKAAREFEAVLVAYMFKSMRSSVSKSGLLGEGFGGDMMDSLLDMEMGRQMSRTGNFGLAEMLWRKITGEPMPQQVALKAPKAALREGNVEAVHRPPALDPAKPPVADPAPAPGAAPAVTPVLTPRKAAGPIRVKTGQAVAERVNTYTSLIREAAEKHGVDENLVKAVIATESAGNPRARSSADAKGLMQLIDSTARSMGVRNSWNPRENILGGVKYLQQMLTRFDGNVEHALASYNAGPAAVEKYGGIPPYRETQAYVGRVMEYLKIFGQGEEEDHGED
jgi:Rod binding domain-containing protein